MSLSSSLQCVFHADKYSIRFALNTSTSLFFLTLAFWRGEPVSRCLRFRVGFIIREIWKETRHGVIFQSPFVTRYRYHIPANVLLKDLQNVIVKEVKITNETRARKLFVQLALVLCAPLGQGVLHHETA